MKQLLYVSLVLIALLAQFALNAKQVEGIYQSKVAVTDRTVQARQVAAQTAMAEVLVRASGDSFALEHPLIKLQLAKANAYVQRYKYLQGFTDESQDSDLNEQLYIEFAFDPLAIRQLLADAEISHWGANRPQVLIWLAIGDDQQRFLLGADEQGQFAQILADAEQVPDVKQLLNDHAKLRGLPIILPLMDLEDSLSINVTDVWGRFVMPIRQASSRYPNDAILAGQLMRQDQVWQARFLLMHQGQTQSFEVTTSDFQLALTSGLDQAVDNIAKVYAVVENDFAKQQLLIAINGINEVAQYAKVLAYLESITAVSEVQVESLVGDRLQVKLTLIANSEAFIQAIALNNKLQQISMPRLEGNYPVGRIPSLFFNWQGE